MSMYMATLPGRELALKFKSLGNMTGKTLDEIAAVAGPPNSRALIANNRILYQWQATGYHIAIMFGSNNRMLRITSEHANIQDPDANDIGRGIGNVIGLGILVIGVLVIVASHC